MPRSKITHHIPTQIMCPHSVTCNVVETRKTGPDVRSVAVRGWGGPRNQQGILRGPLCLLARVWTARLLLRSVVPRRPPATWSWHERRDPTLEDLPFEVEMGPKTSKAYYVARFACSHVHGTRASAWNVREFSLGPTASKAFIGTGSWRWGRRLGNRHVPRDRPGRPPERGSPAAARVGDEPHGRGCRERLAWRVH